MSVRITEFGDRLPQQLRLPAGLHESPVTKWSVRVPGQSIYFSDYRSRKAPNFNTLMKIIGWLVGILATIAGILFIILASTFSSRYFFSTFACFIIAIAAIPWTRKFIFFLRSKTVTAMMFIVSFPVLIIPLLMKPERFYTSPKALAAFLADWKDPEAILKYGKPPSPKLTEYAQRQRCSIIANELESDGNTDIRFVPPDYFKVGPFTMDSLVEGETARFHQVEDAAAAIGMNLGDVLADEDRLKTSFSNAYHDPLTKTVFLENLKACLQLKYIP